MAFTPDSHFQAFTAALQICLARYGEQEDDHSAQQKDQMERLIGLEEQFRSAVIDSGLGLEIYSAFIVYVRDVRRQILDARPYFRVRSTVFTAKISPVLKTRDATALQEFPINHEFLSFVMEFRQWHWKSTIKRLYKEIIALRQETCELLLPLAINRARVFFRATESSHHRSHLEFMDLIQIAFEGLLTGIDKYSPGDAEVVPRSFRATAVGRMGGDLIHNYSETSIHFYPGDKRKLYRANKAVAADAHAVLDMEGVAGQVNIGFDEKLKTNSLEIADILAASSCVSADQSEGDEEWEHPENISRYAAPESSRPDFQAEHRDVMTRLSGAMEALSIFERKVLRLRGVDPRTFAINMT